MTMNGPGMFTVKPHFQYTKAQVELPTCMFKMKNVHGDDQSPGSQQGQGVRIFVDIFLTVLNHDHRHDMMLTCTVERYV